MKQTFNLSKSTLIFYSLIAPFIIGGSFYNLVYGLILGQSSNVRIGAWSLLGFVALPLMLIATYLRNKCVITEQYVRIYKKEFARSEYDFVITERFLAVKDRPLFSILRKIFHTLIITGKTTGEVVFEKDLETSIVYAKKSDQLCLLKKASSASINSNYELSR
ncbi:hypothetical protein QFZ37_003200 [Chryseobacterium ginsenosidimutans]|uniref:hypothetical protein n=1 Tax=Chryseobacterium ginsenosidimutans TaxID=687846 RepID=UPI00277FC043|nr:hypothetical protein [Chryseobacterium ginsenosidimutans]MDQ0594831.1 hypothetical protein [Chryseobacterium ginsenosidimutans]